MNIGDKKTIKLNEIELKVGEGRVRIGERVFYIKNGLFIQFDIVEIKDGKIIAEARGSAETI